MYACDSMGVIRPSMVKAEREVRAMKNRKMKGLWMKWVFCSAMTLAMVVSSLVVPKGIVTAYAEGDEQGSTEDQLPETPASTLVATVATSPAISAYSATQIKNGNFEEIPWQDFVINGVTYTKGNDSGKGKISASFPNGVGEGWNTTEIEPYKGNLFEVWPTGSPLDSSETQKGTSEVNGQRYIEMNTTNPACLYQDLATQGGDVIKWSLQHAARNKHGFEEQRMYVTIGSPEIGSDGKIVAATGTGIVANKEFVDNIHTNIREEGKAEYRYDGIRVGSGAVAFVKSVDDLRGLSVQKTDTEWRTVTGIYVVPKGQDITRFAFCADVSSKKAEEDAKYLSGGNFLDNITFSTLIGSLKATKQADNSVKVSGYWGDTDESKHLVVQIGAGESAAEHYVNMKDVCGKYFEVIVPKETVGNTPPSEIQVYHENYASAAKTVPVTHEHTWTYNNGTENETDKIYAYCSDTSDHTCNYQQLSGTKVSLTLFAPDAVYTGDPYKEGWVSNWSIQDIGLAAKPKITYYLFDGVTKTDSTNSGAKSEGAAPTYAGTYRAQITVKNASDPEDSSSEVTAIKDFTISKLPIDTVAFTEPTTISGGVPATTLQTADNAFYTGSITWNENDSEFRYNKTYQATATLTLKDENKHG